jgi:REP element-mobilizing transposase RayT
MTRPLRIIYPGAFYHVTSRGNEKKDIFINRRDREKFLEYLESATERYGAMIHAYCLMNNHFHLLLETPVGNLSQIMRHIIGAYTTYFNVKRKLCHKYSGASLKEIAGKFDVGVTAVGEASKRFIKKMEEDKSLRKLMAKAIKSTNKWNMES